MYEIVRTKKGALRDWQAKKIPQTVFTTFSWVGFLEMDQRIESVVLEFYEKGEIVAYFVGGIIDKFGVRILGSPFEGWLTCDMGFVPILEFDYAQGLNNLREYAFKELKCHYVRVIGKSIPQELRVDGIIEHTKLLKLDICKPLDEIIDGFTKNGKRYVRALDKKGVIYEKVEFNCEFVEKYYKQLEDVFAKQGFRPFYSLDKLYHLVDAFEDSPEDVLALEAKLEGKCIATLFSFGHDEWAYYIGTASYREYQSYHPNEGLFWKFVEYWHKKGVKYVDLVGYREYKMKYNPEIVDEETIIFQKYPGLHFMKNVAYRLVMLKRCIQGLLVKIESNPQTRNECNLE